MTLDSSAIARVQARLRFSCATAASVRAVSPRETQWNWAPYRMPAAALSEMDEQDALAGGCDEPVQF